MSVQPVMLDSPALHSPMGVTLACPELLSSSPPGPRRRSPGPVMLLSPLLLHRKHVVPRKVKKSFNFRSSTALPSTRQEMASMSTQGPYIATSSRSARPMGVSLSSPELAALVSATVLASEMAFFTFNSAKYTAVASASRHSGDLPPGKPLCPVHVMTFSPSPMSRTRTRTTGFTSRLRNLSPGISSWNRLSSPATRFISAPMGSSMPTYWSTGSRM
mmetsp:Transcript_15181/g.36765  ORF Transcript_15181/g.36765 Transcript_15181/m.36765 type:complete len:217 (-) Transcript_15181:407-1057(-)